jgi:hypothetical protein
MNSLCWGDIERLSGGRLGIRDVACPLCGPDRRDPRNRIRKVLRVWRETPTFAGYACARCGAKGGVRAIHPSYEDRADRHVCRQAHPREMPVSDPVTERKRRLATTAWDEAGELIGTPGSAYLERRGIDIAELPQRISDALRWHPRCPWQLDQAGNVASRRPAIVALFTDIITGAPRGIHRIAPIGDSREDEKRMLGPCRGCVIRLWPDDEVTMAVTLGEGIVTTLFAATRVAHRHTILVPAWAAGDKGHMAAFPVLPGIESLTLLVDHDEGGDGQNAAAKCTSRWTAAGREVVRLTPKLPGADFANLSGDDCP